MTETSQPLSASQPEAQTSNPTDEVIRTKEFAYTADELVTIYKRARVRWRDYALIVACFAIMPLMVLCAQYQQGIGFTPIIVFIVIVALGILYPYFRMWYIRRAWQRREQRGRTISNHFEFDSEAFAVFASTGSASRIKYDALVRVVPDPELFYLYFAPKQFTVLPWRAFQSDADLRQVQKWMENNHVRFTLKHLKVPERY